MSSKPKLRRGNKTEGSNTIMTKSFALKFWSNKISDVDIILSNRLTVSSNLLIKVYSGQNVRGNRGFLYDFSLFQT